MKDAFSVVYYTFSIKRCAIFFNCQPDTPKGLKAKPNAAFEQVKTAG